MGSVYVKKKLFFLHGTYQTCHSLNVVERFSNASHPQLVAPLSAKLMQMCYRTRRRARMKMKVNSPRPRSRWPAVKRLLPQPSWPQVLSGWHPDDSVWSLLFLSIQATFNSGFCSLSPAQSRKQLERLLNLGPTLICPTLKGEIFWDVFWDFFCTGKVSPAVVAAGFNPFYLLACKMETAAAGAAETAGVHASGVQQ